MRKLKIAIIFVLILAEALLIFEDGVPLNAAADLTFEELLDDADLAAEVVVPLELLDEADLAADVFVALELLDDADLAADDEVLEEPDLAADDEVLEEPDLAADVFDLVLLDDEEIRLV